MATLQEEINKKTLLRRDSHFDKLLHTSSHCTLYKYDLSSRKWTRANIGGALFIYKRKNSPDAVLTILNRQNNQNFTQLLTSNMQLKLTPPYLFYFSKEGIFGLWFYAQDECIRTYHSLKAFLTQILQPNSQVSQNKINNVVSSSKSVNKSNNCATRENEEMPPLLKEMFANSPKEERFESLSQQLNNTLGIVNDSKKSAVPSPSSQMSEHVFRHINSNGNISSNEMDNVPSLPAHFLLQPDDNSSDPGNSAILDSTSPPLLTNAVDHNANFFDPHLASDGITPLTIEQMKQALIYLIKKDTNFMSTLHQAYVKSIMDK